MMMTFRVAAMNPFLLATTLDARLDSEDPGELAEVADLVGRGCDARRQLLPVLVDPRRVHADLLGAQHVHVGAVTDEQRLLGPNAQPAQRRVEDIASRLAPADFVRHDDGPE